MRGKIPGPRNILMVAAAIELIFVLWDVLFGPMSILFRDPLERAEQGVGDVLAKAYFACHPLLALAALALAARGRVRPAIVALGAVEAMRWLKLMPSVLQNGLRLEDGFAIQWTVAQIFVFPLIAACGIAFAVRDEQPRFAATLIAVPTLYNLFGFTVYVLRNLVIGL
jgi:hypothetical protein